MATVEADTRPDEISIYFDNGAAFTADQIALIFRTMAALAVHAEAGPDAYLEVVELELGSLRALFRLVTSTRAGVIYSMAALAFAAHQEFGPNSTDEAIIQLMHDADVREVVITTRDKVLTIHPRGEPQSADPPPSPASSWNMPPSREYQALSLADVTRLSRSEGPAIRAKGFLGSQPFSLITTGGAHRAKWHPSAATRYEGRKIFGVPVRVYCFVDTDDHGPFLNIIHVEVEPGRA